MNETMQSDTSAKSLSIYLERHLTDGEKTLTETELLQASNWILILAEPGGGKTELMRSLARKLGTDTINANVLLYTGNDEIKSSLLIDAVDEVASIDQASIFKLLGEIKKAKPTRVIISSRSSEWSQSSTMAFEQFLGHAPLIVRMSEFDRQQQREIFEFHTSGENFQNFESEVSRFNLEMLLPNPQFLKMFADAYLESGKHFKNKRSIFSLAVERLAKEANATQPIKQSQLSLDNKIALASEVFTILLLSAAEGITTTEANENRIYPLLVALLPDDPKRNGIIDTRLFKPGEREHQHRPVHKIVVEYCAANYLVQKISNNSDPLTLWKCLPLIAPNNTSRDELRGLIGWMAALGSKSIQEKLIEIDAYAVLANGDPSQLEPSSKKLLLGKLREIENQDPYFRRGDFWRRFSVAGFFTEDISEEIRPLLTINHDGHLRGLILELISGSDVVKSLSNEISNIAGGYNDPNHIRPLAAECLINLQNYNYSSLLQTLFFECSNTSLNISAKIIEKVGAENYSLDFLTSFLKLCSTLYPVDREPLEIVVGSRYFIRKFVGKLPSRLLEPVLDSLAINITCTCGKNYFDCYCRLGISKVVGLILDRYFELIAPPYSPQKLWSWINKLHFEHQIQSDYSKSVEVLASDTTLRQDIISCAFGQLKDKEKIYELKTHTFQNPFHSHSGLRIHNEDYVYILNYAFDKDNTLLWANFFQPHIQYATSEMRGRDELRKLMRAQANSKPEFMKIWMHSDKQAKKMDRESNAFHRRSNRLRRKNEKKRQISRAHDIQYINANRKLIENGRDLYYLRQFAYYTLHAPDKISLKYGDEVLVRNALINCLDFISPHIPNLSELAKLKCESKYTIYEMILFASCLEILRTKKTLDSVPHSLLVALRTRVAVGYSAVSSDESEKLKEEIDRIIFSKNGEYAETFLREYVEPQLNQPCANPDVWLLEHDPVFCHLRKKLTLEWLEKYNHIELGSLNTLFETAVKYCDHEDLNRIITYNCTVFDSRAKSSRPSYKAKKIFWYVRYFYFNDKINASHWKYLSQNKDNIFQFQQISGSMIYGDRSHWPELSSIKIEAILNAFFVSWKKRESSAYIISEKASIDKANKFLYDIVWKINQDTSPETLMVIKRLLLNKKTSTIKKELQSILAMQIRKQALYNYTPPSPIEVVKTLNFDTIVTVESLRQYLLHELHSFQNVLNGGEFNTTNRFYQGNEHQSENESTAIIAERLSIKFESQGIIITPEHQLKNLNRCDFTASKIINGKRCLVVVEVKGQWHRDLFKAASSQLYDLYSIHPDAEQQGIFLVLWFGKNVPVAGRKKHEIQSPQELKTRIENLLPFELKNYIDIFVLDLSRR
ncbi:NACHT domain-containing protein [Enterobacter bugandensis]|uniref:NACHT domain-containing protein n=1 Tax=Enterobacter bugandensis TaxID=881260 RepID=UPI0020051570|nr:hypothetical protein [Enterobacter bugandensis]MCK6858933.1 hypothetical protein [Enterobacter bugandensis]